MGYLHYKTEFTSDAGQDYTIEIRSKSDATGSDIDFTTGKNGFKLNYKQGKYLRLAMCMPSTVKFSFNVTDDTTRDFVHDVLSTSTGDWYIRVYQDSTLYWGGWITPEFDTYSDMPYPYFVNIKANDSIARLVDKYNNTDEISGANDYQELTYPLEFFDDLYDLETVLGTSYRWSFLFDWWNENTSYLSTVNPLRKTYYNRAAFVGDNENFPLIIESYLKELNGVLKAIGGRFFQAGGLYWLQQDGGLDSNNIDYFKAISPSTSGTEIQVTSVNNTITIDNSTAISATNANILRGTTFTSDPEINSVRANYIHGNSGILFDTSEDYSSLTTIGILGNGSNSYQLKLNLCYREFFTSSAVSPVSTQGLRMSCKWEITLKVGTYYFTDTGWTTTPGVFTSYTGQGTFSTNGGEFSGGEEYTNYTEDFTTGIDRASFRAFTSIWLDEIPTFGEVQFKVEPTAFYWVAGYLYVNILTLINDLPAYGNSSLNSATPTSTEQLLFSTPYPNAMFPIDNAAEDTNIGSQYIAAQNPATQNADLDLGDVALGTPPTTSASNMKTLTYLDGSIYKNAEGFRRGNSGSYIASTSLLLSEYLQATDKPVTILQATIISNVYTPAMTLKYESQIGGSLDRFIFTRGEFIAARDEWRGEWYKSEETTSPGYDFYDNVIYLDPVSDIVDDPTEPPPPPNPHDPPNPHTATKLSTLYNSNVIGELSSALAAGTQTKIFISDLKSDLASGQKITVCDIDGSNPFELTTSASASKAATEVDFVSFTSPKAYATGFLLTIASDLQNHITAEPAGADTQIQFNDGGAFGGDSNLIFNKATGRVGIGTATLSSRLNVGGEILISSGEKLSWGTSGATSIEGSTVSKKLQFRTNSLDRMRIDSAGRVGIGTTTPAEKLEVDGNVLADSFMGSNMGNIYATAIYLTPLDFTQVSADSTNVYTRTEGASSILSSNTAKAYAKLQIPIGYKATLIDFYASGNVDFNVYQCDYTSDSSTLLEAGTTNTQVTFSPTQPTGIEGKYYSVEYDPSSTTDEIYGVKITIEQE